MVTSSTVFARPLKFQKSSLKADATHVEKPKQKKSFKIGTDKGHHFFVSLMLTTATYSALQLNTNISRKGAKYCAAGISLSIGFAKEIKDHRHPKNNFSWKDMLANVIGVGLGITLINQH